MKAFHALARCVIILLMATMVSCGDSTTRDGHDVPKQVTAWTGRPGNLAEWERGPTGYIYGVLAPPNSEESLLVLWKWQDGLMKEASASALPRSVHVVPATGGVCGLCLGREKGSWPYALVKLKDGKVLKQWDVPSGWWILQAGGSQNGKFIAFVARPDVAAAGYDHERDKERARVALIDVEKRVLDWVADLNGRGADMIRRVRVTDDGRYVAVAGWNNGTAMVDAKEGKVLWAKRPKGEISTGYAAFAPDGKLIYTAGSEGCVYGIEVATGNVVSWHWATVTGKAIYAHRVSAMAVSHDGKWLAAGTGPEGEVYVWNLEENDKPQVLPHGQGSIGIVAFSPDAKHVVSVGAGTLKVWQLTE